MRRFFALHNLPKAAAALVAASLLPSGAAQAQHSDVLVTNVAGQVAIGAANDIDGPEESFDLDTVVFENILRVGFAPPTPADYETDEPGFFGLNAVGDADDLATLGAEALPGNADASISLSPFTIDGEVSEVFYWDGMGEVDFVPAPASTTYGFSPAMGFATTGPNGDMDDHPIFQVNDDTAAVPADGVYLVSPILDVEGLASSGPAPWSYGGERGSLFLVSLVDALITTEDDLELVEEALEELEEGITDDAKVMFPGGEMKDFAFYEEAVEFVEGQAVPEPSSVAVAAVAFGLSSVLGWRRRHVR